MESEPGRGTTFTVSLPVAPDSEDWTAATQAAKPSSQQTDAQSTVLLVDDDELVRKGIRRLLQSFGYRVLTATNGQEAIELFSNAGETI